MVIENKSRKFKNLKRKDNEMNTIKSLTGGNLTKLDISFFLVLFTVVGMLVVGFIAK